MRETNDEGIRLPIRLAMIVAENRLDPLGLDQIGEGLDVVDVDTALNEDRSSQAQMLALSLEGACGQLASGCIRSLVKQIGLISHV